MSMQRTEVLDLIARHRQGDPSALDRLIRDLGPALRRVCASLARRTGDDADDLYQDTLLHVIRYLDSYRGDAAFTTWAYTVARSRSIRRRRRARAGTDVLAESAGLSDDDRSLAPSLDDEITAREIGRQLGAALDVLAPVDRDILLLRDGYGMTAAEVAGRVGLTVPAVKTRLHRARTRVRECLGGSRGIAAVPPTPRPVALLVA